MSASDVTGSAGLTRRLCSALLSQTPSPEALSALRQKGHKLFWSSRKKESCFLQVPAKVLGFDLSEHVSHVTGRTQFPVWMFL